MQKEKNNYLRKNVCSAETQDSANRVSNFYCNDCIALQMLTSNKFATRKADVFLMKYK